MIKQLILTTLLTACSINIGGGRLKTTTDFNKNEQVEITTPKKANETQTFELGLTRTNITSKTNTIDEDIKYLTQKSEYTGLNDAINVRAENITQNQYYTNMTYYYPEIHNTTNSNTNLLTKLQITPYKYLKDTEINLRLILSISLRYNDFTQGTELNDVKLKIKTTILESTENWTQYMQQANYYAQGNNKNIIDEILNPNNRFLYNKTEQIDTVTIEKNSTYKKFNKTLDINVTQKDKINYYFVLMEPYSEEINQSNYLSFVSNSNPCWAYPNHSETNSELKIFGTLIPPINDYEIIDIPSLLLFILTMPFTFISQAFNLTLFPGTPYQFNISNLFLTIIGIFIFVFLLKMIIKR